MEGVIAFAQGPFGLISLALLAFGDALIGIGFFVPGEPAFLAAGFLWATSGDSFPAIVVLVSAWLADQASFWIGRRYGTKAALYWLAPLRRRRHWRKASGFLRQHGAKAVILSRVLGPIAWVTPFLAGASRLPVSTFLWSSGFGVVIGVGQFFIYGSLLTAGLQSVGSILGPVLDFAVSHWVAVAVVTAIFVAGVVTWRLLPNRFTLRLCLSFCSAMTVLAAINAVYFFGTGAHAVTVPPSPRPELHSVCALKDLPFLVKPGQTSLHRSQPINVVLLSDTSPRPLMAALGWLQNKTYSQDNITLVDFVVSLFTKELPVSELYWMDRPADSAFQLPGSLSERVHIRWWKAGTIEGQSLYVASVSRDEEIAIKYYKHIPTLLHDIARNVDEERERLRADIQDIAQIASNTDHTVLGTFPLGEAVRATENSEYFTDGGVLFVHSASQARQIGSANCLSSGTQETRNGTFHAHFAG
ncbi:LssY C-terminal domain-containing protein [Roseibium sp.]|uniref:LssY C-terminal domain-containing protein n=1 Tax=Roseibium sp. TaxID=1936156 RepID=UPI003BAEEACF